MPVTIFGQLKCTNTYTLEIENNKDYFSLTMAANSARPILGTEVNFVRDIDSVLETVASRSRGRVPVLQDFVVAPLFHPRNRRDREVRSRRLGPGTRSDTVMSSHDWISNVVGKITPVRENSTLCMNVLLEDDEAILIPCFAVY
jgi:hypothetical protein